MNNQHDFEIYRPAPLLDIPGDNDYTKEYLVGRVWALINFLRSNNLLAIDDLPKSASETEKQFSNVTLRRSHVTEQGLAVLRGALDSWLDQVDLGIASVDTTLLERELKKIRKEI